MQLTINFLSQLLLKILETSNVHCDVKAISEEWRKSALLLHISSSQFKNENTKTTRNYLQILMMHDYSATDKGEVPTPRAISERLVKIRSLAKANGAGHFSVTSGKPKAAKSPKAKSTPRKRKQSDTDSSPVTETPTKRNRNRKAVLLDSEDDFIPASLKAEVCASPSRAVKLEKASDEETIRESSVEKKFEDDDGVL